MGTFFFVEVCDSERAGRGNQDASERGKEERFPGERENVLKNTIFLLFFFLPQSLDLEKCARQ